MVRHATGFEFLWEFAADADAEDEPALRHHVERRHCFGHNYWWPQRQQVDGAPDLQP
jgi:hypothetical protein